LPARPVQGKILVATQPEIPNLFSSTSHRTGPTKNHAHRSLADRLKYFMTFAWYVHLKYRSEALWKVIIASWGIAFFEYCFQVPANRIGSYEFNTAQLKTIQEVIRLTVFAVFSVTISRRKVEMELRRRRCVFSVGRFLRLPQMVTILKFFSAATR
jgi:uncharacterized protein (DUF486 family)